MSSIQILNCGSLHPYLPRIHGGVTCLLVQSSDGFVLVDTGFGVEDYRSPTRLMNLFLSALRNPRSLEETALHQVRRLGFDTREVRHIVVTHLHLDHAGGLPDFPHADVHIFTPEFEHAVRGDPGWAYIRRHWEHGPRWVPHSLERQLWFEFDAVRVGALQPEIWLVPLVGHTPGHCGVAVQRENGWLLHAGDAVPFNVAVDQVPHWVGTLLLGPHSPRLQAFMQQTPEVEVVGAHMDLAFYSSWGGGCA